MKNQNPKKEPTPSTPATDQARPATANERLDRFKTLSDIIATWVTVIGALAGGIFALIQYHDNSVAERVKETIRYTQRFNEKTVQDAHRAHDKFWKERANAIFSDENRDEKKLGAYVLKEITDHKMQVTEDKLVDFYEDLFICTKSGLCDEDTMRQYFGKRAYDHYGMLYFYLVAERDRTKDRTFGCGMEVIGLSYHRNVPLNDMKCSK